MYLKRFAHSQTEQMAFEPQCAKCSTATNCAALTPPRRGKQTVTPGIIRTRAISLSLKTGNHGRYIHHIDRNHGRLIISLAEETIPR